MHIAPLSLRERLELCSDPRRLRLPPCRMLHLPFDAAADMAPADPSVATRQRRGSTTGTTATSVACTASVPMDAEGGIEGTRLL